MKFIKRTNAPVREDAHYYSDNIFFQSGYGLPNCTCYAWGRWYELLNEKPKLCINNAKDWYNFNDGYARSQEPKVGAVACYDGGQYGHVAIVEEIYSDGTMLISESDYVSKILFRTRVIGQHADAYNGYKLLGFIVLPIEFEEDKKDETPKTIDELAQEVIAGKWDVEPERSRKLTEAGYDAKAVQDKVNEIYGIKPVEVPAVEDTIKVGDKVKVLNAIQYTGETFKTWFDVYEVIEVVNDRVVIGVDGVVTCAINIKDIQKI